MGLIQGLRLTRIAAMQDSFGERRACSDEQRTDQRGSAKVEFQ
jgi:hypothetical protein